MSPVSAVWEDWQPSTAIMKPATVIGWHREGFGLFWTWRIRREKLGRPAVPEDVRSLIRAMSRDDPLWGAPQDEVSENDSRRRGFRLQVSHDSKATGGLNVAVRSSQPKACGTEPEPLV